MQFASAGCVNVCAVPLGSVQPIVMVTVAVDTADMHTMLASALYMLVAVVVANVVKDVAQVA